MEIQNVSKARTNVRLFAAVIGGSAVVAMAALGVAIGQESGGDAVAKSSSMSVGSDEHPDHTVRRTGNRSGQAHDQGPCAAAVGGGGRQVGRVAFDFR